MHYNTHAPWRTTSTIQTNGTATIFSFGYQFSGPFYWQNPCSGCNSGTDWVAALEYIFFQLCFNTELISEVHKMQKKLCKPPCCCSDQPLLKLHSFFAWYALFKVATFLFCSCLSPMIVYLLNLFLLSKRVAQMLLTSRRASRQKDVK